ncbi:ubiquitin-protein ligase [Wolffia australiana]
MSASATGADLSLRNEALSQFASTDVSEWCQEAKVEFCRAFADFTTCGRYVKHNLSPCGHASLCEECSRSCSSCPICRTALRPSGRSSLRLFDKCLAAGLIEMKDDLGYEKTYPGEHLDVQRLYSLFDVALENYLVSSICHYVTDVCLDENAVSSDPVVAFLLDEVVVKNWCRLKFKSVLQDLRQTYAFEDGLQNKMNFLQKLSVSLTGISNVLAILESAFAGSLSSELHDLHWLLENTSKTKQHLDIIIWCVRHKFLDNTEARFPDSDSWSFDVRERKLAAVKRSWPNSAGFTSESTMQHESTLFIEDALSNLQLGQDLAQSAGDELDARALLRDTNALSNLSAGTGILGIYPFLDLRSAADILFLHGSSDMSVAKRAIFLYYLFDRHWSLSDDSWRNIVYDFGDSFGLQRRSILESFVFYLLDDHSDDALQQAGELLPQITGPDTHPKVAEVLLERQRPELALMVMRCCGHDVFSADSVRKHDTSHIMPFDIAVTAVRVRIECGLLTQAFVFQRTYCTMAKDRRTRAGSSELCVDEVKVLVTEICLLCVRRNLVDRMIELPWSSDEEPFIHKSLYEKACQEPSSIIGSLLAVYYLQRHRYIEAYQIDRKLRNLEQKFCQTTSEEELSKIKSISLWREGLIVQSLELLPEVQRLQLKFKSHNDVSCSEVTYVGSEKESLSSADGFIKPPVVLNPYYSVLGEEDSVRRVSYNLKGEVRATNGFSAGKSTQKHADLSSQRSIGSPVTPFQWKLSKSAAPTRSQGRNADGFTEKAKFSSSLRVRQADSVPSSARGGYQASQEKHKALSQRFEQRETPMVMTTNGVPRWRSDDSSEDDDRAELSMGSRMLSLKRRGRQGI